MATYSFDSKFAIGEIVYREEHGELVETEIIEINARIKNDGSAFVQYYYYPFNPSENNYKQIINEEHLHKRK